MPEVGGDPHGAPPPAARVREQLARILASDGFIASQRLCRFLRFIVERTLEDDTERLKEFVVAVEVFDRDENYDPAIDSIVRVEARRLRGKLKAYYEGPGARDPVLIGLRPGSYVPLFRNLQEPESLPAPVPARTPTYTTVAVLPFVNMSPEPEQDYFCDGITEEIINALAAIENVAVVARSSAFQFKGQALDVREVGQRLGAEVVVEGSVRKAGHQLRITAQAIDAAKGYHLWSETYRRELNDVFAIQEEISAAVARTLRANLPQRPAPATRQPGLEAYTGYCRALHKIHQQNIPGLYAALAEFQELTRLYPDYADPWAGIATVHAVLSLFGAVSGKQVAPDLRRHAEQAVRLDPASASAWTVMGGISAHWDFDWNEAERRFRKAIALQPSNYEAHSWFGMVLAMLGRFAEAQGELDIALRLGPLSPSSYTRQGTFHYLRGDAARSLSALAEADRLAPEFPDTRLITALVHTSQGNDRAAVEALAHSVQRMPLPVHVGMLAGAHARAGQAAESARLLAELETMAASHYVTPLARVIAHVGRRDSDAAFRALEDAVEERAVFIGLLNVDPYYEPLRHDPRFAALLKTLRLPA